MMRWKSEATNPKADVWTLGSVPRGYPARGSSFLAKHLPLAPLNLHLRNAQHSTIIVCLRSIVIVHSPYCTMTSWQVAKQHCRNEGIRPNDRDGSERLCAFSAPVSDMLVWLLLAKVKSRSFRCLYHIIQIIHCSRTFGKYPYSIHTFCILAFICTAYQQAVSYNKGMNHMLSFAYTSVSDDAHPLYQDLVALAM